MREGRWSTVSAAAGAVAWIALCFGTDAGRRLAWIEQQFLLAPLVVVPLVLVLIAPDRPRASVIYRLVVAAQPIGAVAATAAVLVRPGPVAGALSGVWLAVTALMAVHGAWLLSRGLRHPEEAVISAGLLYSAVGGGWLCIYALGVRPMGYDDIVVLLTAVHYHFAGLAAPVLTGLAGRMAPARSRAFMLAATGIVLGPLLVAAGIVFSRPLELVGAAILAAGVFVLAGAVMPGVLREVRGVARLFLAVSTASSVIALGLAVAYAYGRATGIETLSIPWMARSHAPLNAFGFVFGGLVGWLLYPDRPGSREARRTRVNATTPASARARP